MIRALLSTAGLFMFSIAVTASAIGTAGIVQIVKGYLL